jgi:hypothetical protein
MCQLRELSKAQSMNMLKTNFVQPHRRGPPLADCVIARMLRFSSFIELIDKDMQSLYEKVDKKTTALAVAGAIASIAAVSYAVSNPNTNHLCKSERYSTIGLRKNRIGVSFLVLQRLQTPSAVISPLLGTLK